MSRLFYLIVWALGIATPAMAQASWSGNWEVTWAEGGGVLTLEQHGSSVRGRYDHGQGSVEAVAEGEHLKGQIIGGGAAEPFSATLSDDEESFSGHTDAGDWLRGDRIGAADSTGTRGAPDLRTPRSALREFLSAGNLARYGDHQALGLAVRVIDFDSRASGTSFKDRFSAAKTLFDTIDRASFTLAEVPIAASTPSLTISLPILDTRASVEISMSRGSDGNWRIVMPSHTGLQKMNGGEAPRPADAFRKLMNPRDAMRLFLDGMYHWQDGGDLQAISTLDLSDVPALLLTNEGQLTAQVLVRVLDRVGYLPLQSIPNSVESGEPFIYFDHPAGRIVIEPVGNGSDTRWKFSRETVRDLRRLYRAIEKLPVAHTLDSRFIPPSAVFAARDVVKDYAPALLGDVTGKGRVEYWQLLAGLLTLGLIAILTLLFRRALFWLLSRPAIKHHVTHPWRLAGALGVGIAFATGAQLLAQIGFSAAARQYTAPALGTLLLAVLTYAGWATIAAISSGLEHYAERTKTGFDNIMLTFGAGVARVALVTAAGLSLGHLWSIPTTGLLAGIGISGIAVAFASRETLANIFGAGVLLGDRPFRTGDRIIAGDVNGWVEAVGLRSTRIRTLSDSLMIVPNGKLADMSINNIAALRRRSVNTTLLVTSISRPDEIDAFTRKIQDRVLSDPLFVPEATEVNISRIDAEGVEISLSTSLNTRYGSESRKATHQLLLDILRMAEALGLSLARRPLVGAP